jgi:hypothetical protein
VANDEVKGPRLTVGDQPPGEGTGQELPEPPPPPPPPPWARRGATPAGPDAEGDRRPRWRVVLLVVLALVVIGVPVGLALVASMSDGADSADVGADGDGDDPATTEPGEPPDDELATDLDLDDLAGRDAALGRLLVSVDRSEQAMIGFQSQVEAALTSPDAGEPGQLLEEVRAAARTGSDELSGVRPELVDAVDDPSVEEVRAVYLTHHDVWADYLEAVEEDPAVLAREDEGARWTLSINSSAEAFARALREELDDDLDEDVRDLGQQILDRGFDRGDVRPDA